MTDTILLQIAKTAILSKFDENYILDENTILKEYPFLKSSGAVFVTLKYDNNLRGCIGSIIAHRRLFDDIVQNAISAGFNDPRFKPLSVEELSHLSLEVQKIKPNKDGLILKHGRFQGTFLPQVWEQLATPELFLEHLSMKAGATPSIYSEHPSIYRYGVEHIEEDFDEILPL